MYLVAFITLLAAIFTAGISWLIIPFLAKALMVDFYTKKGYNIISKNPKVDKSKSKAKATKKHKSFGLTM
jgi:hypothetical protein